MSRNKVIVQSLDSALAWADRYGEPAGFKVAPLSSLGGARNWHVVDFGSSRWVRDDEAQAAWVPLDIRPEILPALPPSKISRWAFAFVAERGTLQKPELTIWPDAKTTEEQPRGPTRTVYPENELVTILLEGLRDAHASTRESLKQSHADLSAAYAQMCSTLTVARTEMQHMGESRRQDFAFLSEQYQTIVNLLKSDIETLRQERDEYHEKYMRTQELLLMRMHSSELHLFIREVFGGKPELFIKTVTDIIDSIRKWTKHGATDPKAPPSSPENSEETRPVGEDPQLWLPLRQGKPSRQAG